MTEPGATAEGDSPGATGEPIHVRQGSQGGKQIPKTQTSKNFGNPKNQKSKNFGIPKNQKFMINDPVL